MSGFAETMACMWSAYLGDSDLIERGKRTVASIHFVIPHIYHEQLDALENRVLGADYPYWISGAFNWAAQSWLRLRQYREGLTIGTTPAPERINFAHCMTWRALGARCREFRVSARADYPQLFDVDFEILQNPAMPVRADRSAYLPYWPIPGLIPRDSSRAGVNSVAYAGRFGPRNLDCSLVEGHEAFRGLEFRTIRPERWHDMSEIDLLIGIRDFDGKLHYSKPPSKLFNAWLANVPLIGGCDSSYSATGTPGKDYLRVGTSEELCEAVARLRRDGEYYDSIVAAGRIRARECTPERVARQWLEVLEGPVAQAFARWRELPKRMGGLSVRRALDVGRNSLSSLRRRLS